MSSTDRQNRLLVAQDWKRIYQTYANADFTSYDFDNLRRVIISYIRENYPEDFNDYIESSEYLALIDLIAYVGQSFAFRTDLNARENFIELAERRESVLRLSRLLSYNAKRNIAASGLLKITALQTTQTVFDSNGRNLANQVVGWNDPANSNWKDQFFKILNSSLPASRQFGNPDSKMDVYGISTEQYRFQSANTSVPVYSFNKNVDGRSMTFEVMSTTFNSDDGIYEEPPAVGNRLGFIYRNDGKGNGSVNTGFYLMFKQGILNQGTFTITQPATNETVDLDAVNINDSDVWLYRLDQNGIESEFWKKVPSLTGNNIIYNSVNKAIRNIYSVVTRTSDKISLLFSDGLFGNIPLGTFRVYYRASNGISYTINSKDIRNVVIEVPYISNVGQLETLSLTLGLQQSVSNSSTAETLASIKANAPAVYYTQNRMITAEDYNIAPLAVNQEVIKVKAINRTSSGISRYYDLVDPTGKYSKTNLFADDGAVYKEEYESTIRFSYTNKTDIEGVIYNKIRSLLESTSLRDFYYTKFNKIITESLQVDWNLVTSDTGMSTGYIVDRTNRQVIYKLGSYTGNNLKFLTAGSLVLFVAPEGYYFNKANNNELTVGSVGAPNSTSSLWASIVSVAGDGTNNGTGILSSGYGTVKLNKIVDSQSATKPIISQVIPTWITTLDSNTVATMVDLIFSNKAFGLRYDIDTLSWKIVFEGNLNLKDEFSLGKQGDTSNQALDSSWLILFTTDNEFYTVKTRLLRYIFESDSQVRFYFDSTSKMYDSRSNTTVNDRIRILGINTDPNSTNQTSPFTYDRVWNISDEYKGLDGYVDSKKIEVTFSDSENGDGIVDNPLIFDEVVAPNNSLIDLFDRYVVLEKYEVLVGQEDYRLLVNPESYISIQEKQSNFSAVTGISYYYFIDTDSVVYYDRTASTLTASLDYKVFVGRRNIKFQYTHNADYESRIDPGVTNIVDIYVLTKQYDKLYRQWLVGTIKNEPLPPSTDYLYNLMNISLSKIKSISDEIIYHPVKYKILFGENADIGVQATFKVEKNTNIVISDNDIKTRVLSAINEFFSLENWDFGDSFYFSELSAYVMNRLTPNIVNFLIVPKDGTLNFGSLFEIRSEKDQIFINGATVADIEIITGVTASIIKSAGAINTTGTSTGSQNISSGSY
jgi:hypothetical protein